MIYRVRISLTSFEQNIYEGVKPLSMLHILHPVFTYNNFRLVIKLFKALFVTVFETFKVKPKIYLSFFLISD